MGTNFDIVYSNVHQIFNCFTALLTVLEIRDHFLSWLVTVAENGMFAQCLLGPANTSKHSIGRFSVLHFTKPKSKLKLFRRPIWLLIRSTKCRLKRIMKITWLFAAKLLGSAM